MILRAIFLAAFLLAAPGPSHPGTGATASAQSGAVARRTKKHAGSSIYFYVSPRSVLDRLVHTIPADDANRLARLRTEFAHDGCVGRLMTIEAVWSRRDPAGSNLICTWPGTTDSTVVVAAHYNREGKGQAAVDDWSGAALLPFLYLAIQAQPRQNTWVFIETWGKAGSSDYLKLLPSAQRRHIHAMIALDGLGIHPVARYFSPDAQATFPAPGTTDLQLELLAAARVDDRVPLPQSTDPQFWLAIDDTAVFRAHGIPSILIHSISDNDARIPGSALDTAGLVDANAYYANYRLLCVYLVSLDSGAAKFISEARDWGSR